jgi:YHS domain-containing protein
MRVPLSVRAGFRALAFGFLTLSLLTVRMLAPAPIVAGEAINQNPAGIAIKGYDPVAYFTESKPVKGERQFQHKWMGAKWQFSSAANRDLFAADPKKYVPQYGGYCAYGVSEGHKAPIDPKAWTIIDERLYLNYDSGVQETWRKDTPGNISKADRNWPKIAKD